MSRGISETEVGRGLFLVWRGKVGRGGFKLRRSETTRSRSLIPEISPLKFYDKTIYIENKHIR